MRSAHQHKSVSYSLMHARRSAVHSDSPDSHWRSAALGLEKIVTSGAQPSLSVCRTSDGA